MVTCPPYPPHPTHPIYPPPPPSPQASPFAAVVPSPAVFPPGTDPNAVACFQLADRNKTGTVDDEELQKGLSLYHHSFSRRVIRLLIYIHTNSYENKIGPKQFVQLYNSLVNWKAIFEKYDHDRNGAIDATELSNALMSFGYGVTPSVLEKLVSKFGNTQGDLTKAIHYDYFIECCLILKGLSDIYREKDTKLRGSVDFGYETFMCNIVPYIAAACLPDDLPTQPPPKAAVVFPPDTPPNAVACFLLADRDCTGIVDDKELQKALSLYHHSFNRSTIRLLIYVHTKSYSNKIGPTEFVEMYNSLVHWKETFEKYDRDQSGTIDASELGDALMSFGYAVTPLVLENLISKYGKEETKTKGIEYDNFIECCLTIKGLSDRYREKDTMLRGSVTFEYETFMCTIVPFMAAACLSEDENKPCQTNPSPFEAVLPSPVEFPPGTDPNAVACFHTADHDNTGFIDDKELQKSLSLYHYSFSLRTVRLLIYIHTNSYENKIGPAEFVQLYSSLVHWKATFEKFDHDRSGTIEASELGEVLMSFGYAVTPAVLQKFMSKFGEGETCNRGIEYDYFIEYNPTNIALLLLTNYLYCKPHIPQRKDLEFSVIDEESSTIIAGLGLSDRFREKDTLLRGSVNFEYEQFICTIIPLISGACLPTETSSNLFPPGTDLNAIACFKLADRYGTGFIDDIELQKSLSVYHHSFSRRIILLLIYIHTNNYDNKIGPTEFVQMYNSLVSWKGTFEKYDRNHNGKIDASDLGGALLSFGYSVTPLVSEKLVSKFGLGEAQIEYDYFVECCMIMKGLSYRFREKDTTLCGSACFESFMCTFIPFLVAASLPEPGASAKSPCPPPPQTQCPKGASAKSQSSCPSLPHAHLPPQSSRPPHKPVSRTDVNITKLSLKIPPPSAGSPHAAYPYPTSEPSSSPFTAAVPSPVVFPPDTDANVVACFESADHKGTGLIDVKDLQKSLSLYHYSFNHRTICLLIYVHTGSLVNQIGVTEFIQMYNNILGWKAIFEKYDRDHSGTIDASELGDALMSFGYAVPPTVLQKLVSKYGKGEAKSKAIHYDYFIECCATVKGLSDRFREMDTTLCGSAAFGYEAFLCTIVPFMSA